MFRFGIQFSRINLYNIFGGAKRDRTADLLLARQALSQLSYGPKLGFKLYGGPWWTRTTDLTLIRGAL